MFTGRRIDRSPRWRPQPTFTLISAIEVRFRKRQIDIRFGQQRSTFRYSLFQSLDIGLTPSLPFSLQLCEGSPTLHHSLYVPSTGRTRRITRAIMHPTVQIGRVEAMHTREHPTNLLSLPRLPCITAIREGGAINLVLEIRLPRPRLLYVPRCRVHKDTRKAHHTPPVHQCHTHTCAERVYIPTAPRAPVRADNYARSWRPCI